MPYTIYAASRRLPGAALAALQASPNIRFPRLPETDLRGSREHSFYLQRLLQAAIDDDCEYICTLDCDSFPITFSWWEALSGATSSGNAVAAVVRSENGDTVLTHPSCVFSHRDFMRTAAPLLHPDVDCSEPTRAALMAFAQRHGQAVDTGIGFSYAIELHAARLVSLRRSNEKNLHWLIAGIYGGLIFHLGGTGRQNLEYRGDMLAGRSRIAAEERNKAALMTAYTRLMEDDRGFLAYLYP